MIYRYFLVILAASLVTVHSEDSKYSKDVKPELEKKETSPEDFTTKEDDDDENRQAAVHQYRSVCHGDGTCTYIFTLTVPSKMGMPLPPDVDSMTGNLDAESPKVKVIQEQLKKLHNTLYNLTTANHKETMMLTNNVNSIQSNVKHIGKQMNDIDSKSRMLNDGYSSLQSNVGQIEAKFAAATRRAKDELGNYMKKIKAAKIRMQRIEAIVTGNIPKENIYLTIAPNKTERNPLRHVVAIGTDCATLYKAGMKTSGVYTIKPDPGNNGTKFDAYCDMETDGGGWTVIQRREDGSENFNRKWNDYKDGFGDIHSEHWLGLEKAHVLNERGNNAIRFDLWDFEDASGYVYYSKFKLSGEDDKYRIQVGRYSGDGGNAFHYGNHFLRHNNMQFSTSDNDNDQFGRSCPRMYHSGWWFHNCMVANLNGLYYEGGVYKSHRKDGIMWQPWRYETSLRKTEIKVRPKDFLTKEN